MNSRLFRSGVRLLELYNHQAKTRPLITMSWTTGASMAIGSYMCQIIKNKVTKSNDPIDYRQIFDYACFGAFLTGPRFSIIAAFIFYVSLTQHKPFQQCCQDLKEVKIPFKSI